MSVSVISAARFARAMVNCLYVVNTNTQRIALLAACGVVVAVSPLYAQTAYENNLKFEQLVATGDEAGLKNHRAFVQNEIPDGVRDYALLNACRLGHAGVISILLKHGANINTKTDRGHDCLTYATSNRRIDAMKVLLDAGSAIERRDNDGSTALMNAAVGKRIEALTFLLDRGADINTRNNRGWTPLIQAVMQNEPETVKVLIARKADIELRDNDGLNALMMAAGTGAIEIARMLLDRGAKIDAGTGDGTTALMYAATAELGAVKLLVARGAQINSLATDGRTALYEAIQNDQVEIVRFLLSKGASIAPTQIESLTREGGHENALGAVQSYLKGKRAKPMKSVPASGK